MTDRWVNDHINFIIEHGISNDRIPDDSINEVVILIEKIFANTISNEILDGYCKAENKYAFIEDNVRKEFIELKEYDYKDLMLRCNLSRSIGNNLKVILSIETFKSKANISNIIKLAYEKLEEKLLIIKQQEENRKRAEIESNRKRLEYINLEKATLNYFKEEFPREVNKLDEVNDIEEIKNYYKHISKIVKAKINLLNNRYYHYDPSKYPFQDEYSNILRLKVINRLKELERFDPYKEIINNIIEIKPGYHHHASNEHKDSVCEWDIYFTKRPSIDRAINKRINFKLLRGEEITAEEYFYLFKNKNLTQFGYEHLYDVIDKMSILIKEKESNMGVSLAHEYSLKYGSSSKYLSELCLIPTDFPNKKANYWNFHHMKKFEKQINEITREAENMVREEMNLPKVNQGWISETKLYQQIKEHFKNKKVIQHARLRFLGKQHLDIFIPSLKVAIEFQGLQHDEPVNFFGGEEAFLKNKQRDELKFNLCQENDIKIIYIREGYDLSEIIKEIEESL